MWQLLRALFTATPPAPEYIHEQPAEFGLASAPDWVLEWTGWALPHGGGYRGRLALQENERPATAQVERPISRTKPTVPRAITLPELIEDCLRAILRETFPAHLLSVREECRDGFPLEVTVHHREPYQGVRAGCNLGDAFEVIRGADTQTQSWSARVADTVEGKPLAPVFRIGFLLFELSFMGAPKT
jgi:hypothetical protein